MARKTGAPARAPAVAARALAKPAPPLHTILMEGTEEDMTTMTSSIFEAKGGVRAAVLRMSGEEAFKAMTSSPVLKKSRTRVAQAMKRGTPNCLDPLSAGNVAMKRFKQSVMVCCGGETRSKRTLPNAEWYKKIFGFNLYGCDSTSLEAAWPLYGLMQAHVILDGTMAFCGLRSDRASVQSFAEKRANVMRMTVGDIHRSLRTNSDGGFFCRSRDGVCPSGESFIVIPTGYILLTAGSSATCLRWSLMADEADVARVKATLLQLLENFPEFRQPETGYIQMAQHLGLTANL